MCVQLQGYSLTGITEVCWDGSHDWRVAMEGYRLFRKDRPRRPGVAHYVREPLECLELHLGMDDEPTQGCQQHKD